MNAVQIPITGGQTGHSRQSTNFTNIKQEVDPVCHRDDNSSAKTARHSCEGFLRDISSEVKTVPGSTAWSCSCRRSDRLTSGSFHSTSTTSRVGCSSDIPASPVGISKC
eukprot:gb/GECG01014635.1/.p1 GENE.gb/GECG01014635.1/~~gb/GECG01014635.1/.p1  ORF type:complete len:109 (+),score=7.20 gb/GECG01014635.1/:1-327(+)